ncbi:mg247 protein [Tupanvirus deep ocean]|uniref:Mg247 protein n=2 Tax=Tupanvirus TaxID=2094720 RepID=A0AC62A945_9VIRU|nr:mg247 protein [Tupanvirus deep ocean]QKU34300.1 mg247 protein [Tupanvirus deep ocean]
MVKYFKVTNLEEIHNDFAYIDGLNSLDGEFEETNDHVENGLYFTTIDYIPKYYYLGINLREIILPNDNEFKMIKLNNGDKFRANKIILGKKYSLYDPITYDMFGLNMEYNIHLVNHASEHAHINFLDKWKENKWNLKYSTDAIDLASQNGHVEVLEWWVNSGFELKYTKHAIDWACEYGHEKILVWWFKSGLVLKYTVDSIVLAVKNGHKNIIESWKKYFNMPINEICEKKITDEKILTTINTPVSQKSFDDKPNYQMHLINWFKENFKFLFLNLLFMVVLILFMIFN